MAESTNNDIVALAVFQCGGTTETVDIEFIADTAYQLAPTRFGWRHFPDRIDLRTVQYALKNEATEHKPRITGSLKYGYQMTAAGVSWAKEHLAVGTHHITGSRVGSTEHHLEIERHRLRQSAAYRKVADGRIGELSSRDYESFVRVNEYFPKALRQERIQKIDNLVSGQVDLEPVWKLLCERFKE